MRRFPSLVTVVGSTLILVGCGSENSGAMTETGAHCSPGVRYGGFEVYADGPMSNCHAYDPDGGGIDIGSRTFVRDIVFEPPLAPGQRLAFSIGRVVQDEPTTIEFWGSNAECGPGLEQLGSAPMSLEIVCTELGPASASYSHILVVWRSTGEHGDVTICPMGSCSN